MDTTRNRIPIVFAWSIILLISDLPNILFVIFLKTDPLWLPWVKIGLLCAVLLLCFFWKPLRLFWQFNFVFLVFYLANAGVDWVVNTGYWQSHFSGKASSFSVAYLSFHMLDIFRALLVIAAMWWVKRSPANFYLAIGQLDAPIGPVRWLGIKPGESWKVFGWIFTSGAGIAVLITLAFSVPLTATAFSHALPLLPVAILLAALNAFAEESYFRASMLSTLSNLIGKDQALLLACIFFGLAHWVYGSPPGLIGFAMTAFLAFLLGKSMLETKGMLWAWIIHFVPDVLIFFSYALTWD